MVNTAGAPGRTDPSADGAVIPAAVRPIAGRVGVLGGTFDPCHIGHLAAAEEARERLGLERVLFVPAGDPWQKADRAVSDGHHRLAMVQLAIEANPFFAASTVELDRPGPSYAVDTAEALADAERAAGRSPDLWFILSVEAARGLGTWHRPDGLLAACRLAIVPRPGSAPFDPGSLDAIAPDGAGRAVLLDAPRLDVSGTAVRARARAGRSIRYLVPAAVEAYIDAHGLYRPHHMEEPPT